MSAFVISYNSRYDAGIVGLRIFEVLVTFHLGNAVQNLKVRQLREYAENNTVMEIGIIKNDVT